MDGCCARGGGGGPHIMGARLGSVKLRFRGHGGRRGTGPPHRLTVPTTVVYSPPYLLIKPHPAPQPRPHPHPDPNPHAPHKAYICPTPAHTPTGP